MKDDDLFSFFYERTGEELTPEPEQGTDDSLPWMKRAIGVCRRKLEHDWTGTGEDIRRIVLKEIGPPHSQHAWGALINQLASRHVGVLVDTGKVRKMKAAKSHGRRTPVYRRG